MLCLGEFSSPNALQLAATAAFSHGVMYMLLALAETWSLKVQAPFYTSAYKPSPSKGLPLMHFPISDCLPSLTIRISPHSSGGVNWARSPSGDLITHWGFLCVYHHNGILILCPNFMFWFAHHAVISLSLFGQHPFQVPTPFFLPTPSLFVWEFPGHLILLVQGHQTSIYSFGYFLFTHYWPLQT